MDDNLDERMFDCGKHYLCGPIDHNNVAAAIKWIIASNVNKQHKHLTLYINSSGGDLYESFALVDAMRISSIPIHTVGIGQVMSGAFLIFVSGTKKHRLIANHAGIMCHQYDDTMVGKYHDIKAQMIEGEYCYNRMLSILQSASGLSETEIKDTVLKESDVYLTAEQLIQYKFADQIIGK